MATDRDCSSVMLEELGVTVTVGVAFVTVTVLDAVVEL
jgi:hypothetical protein